MSKVKVIEKNSRDILFECSVEESEKAYTYAAQMEELGLDVTVIAPSIAESLNKTLGASTEDLERIKNELLEEIESHNCDSCTHKPDNIH